MSILLLLLPVLILLANATFETAKSYALVVILGLWLAFWGWQMGKGKVRPSLKPDLVLILTVLIEVGLLLSLFVSQSRATSLGNFSLSLLSTLLFFS